MPKSATDTMQEIIFSSVIDAVMAMKDASRGLPNALLRDLNSLHQNSTLGDLPEPVQAAIGESVRAAFARLRKEGYTVADAASVRPAAPPRGPQSPRPAPGATGGARRPGPRTPRGRPGR